jgi:hypothetical protein
MVVEVSGHGLICGTIIFQEELRELQKILPSLARFKLCWFNGFESIKLLCVMIVPIPKYINIFPVSMTAGTTYGGMWDGWYGPSGRGEAVRQKYDMYEVTSSLAGRAVSRVGTPLTPAIMQTLRNEAEVICDSSPVYAHVERSECKPLIAPCLFNTRNDPCEQHNLADM